MKFTKKKVGGGLAAACILVYVILVIVAYLPRETVAVQDLAGPDSRFVQVKGCKIHYVQKGSGPVLVLVHGFAGSTYTWRHVMQPLSAHFTVYALDLPGFGLSDKPVPGEYDMFPQGRVIIGFMKALGISEATLVGHSMGGVVVSCAAIEAPASVEGLVLVEPGFYMGAPPVMQYMFFPLDRIMARQFYTRSFRTSFLKGSFYNKALVTDEVIDAYMGPTHTPNAVKALAYMMTSVGTRTYEDVSTSVERPTLILWGLDPGQSTEDRAERARREIRGSRLQYVNSCGHYIQEEKPQELVSAILDFYNSKDN